MELNEIENNIKACPSILDAAVVAIEPNKNSVVIAANIVLREGATISDVKKYLEQILPVYMMPQVWNELSLFPVNSSNKVDYLSLKTSVLDKLKVNNETRSETEQQLCSLLQEILGTDSLINTHEDLHFYGVDSLKLVVFLNKISETMGVNIPLQSIASKLTLQNIAALIHQQDNSNEIATCRIVQLDEKYKRQSIEILVDSFLLHEVFYRILRR